MALSSVQDRKGKDKAPIIHANEHSEATRFVYNVRYRGSSVSLVAKMAEFKGRDTVLGDQGKYLLKQLRALCEEGDGDSHHSVNCRNAFVSFTRLARDRCSQEEHLQRPSVSRALEFLVAASKAETCSPAHLVQTLEGFLKPITGNDGAKEIGAFQVSGPAIILPWAQVPRLYALVAEDFKHTCLPDGTLRHDISERDTVEERARNRLCFIVERGGGQQGVQRDKSLRQLFLDVDGKPQKVSGGVFSGHQLYVIREWVLKLVSPFLPCHLCSAHLADR